MVILSKKNIKIRASDFWKIAETTFVLNGQTESDSSQSIRYYIFNHPKRNDPVTAQID